MTRVERPNRRRNGKWCCVRVQVKNIHTELRPCILTLMNATPIYGHVEVWRREDVVKVGVEVGARWRCRWCVFVVWARGYSIYRRTELGARWRSWWAQVGRDSVPYTSQLTVTPII